MNKKMPLFLYYIGLSFGIIVMNYMLHNHKEYADGIIESFLNIKHMENIHGQDLFLYLLLKRGKQFAIICFLYMQISQYGTILILDFCFAFILSSFLSLYTIYYDMFDALKMTILLIPQYLGYVFLKNMGNKYSDRRKVEKSINITKICFLLIVVTIIMTTIEITINFKLSHKILSYKR